MLRIGRRVGAAGDGDTSANAARPRSWRRRVAWAAVIVILIVGAVGAALLWRHWSTRAERAERLYDAAMAMQALPMARDAIRRATQIDENEPRYWLKLARVQVGLGALQDALTAFDRVLDFDPENIEALQTASELAAAGGLIDEAREHVRTLMNLQPQDVRGRIVLVALAVRQSRFDEAVERADALLAAGVETDDVFILKSRALGGLKRDAEAVRMLEARDRQTPGDVPVLRELVAVYTRLDDKAGINRAMGRLAAVMPDNIDFQLAGARELARNGRPDVARAQADAAQSRGAADPDIQVKVVDYWSENGDRTDALAAARRAATAGNDAVKIAMAQKLLDLGAPAEAMQMIAPFAQPQAPVAAGNVVARTIYGNAVLATRGPAAAKSVADDVLAFDETNLPGLLLRTRIGIAIRRYDQALTDAQMLVNGDAGSEPGLLLLAQVHGLRGERTLADVSYGTARKLFPDSIAVLDAGAGWLLRTGRAGEAAALATDFVDDHPRSAPGRATAIAICTRAANACAARLRALPKAAGA